MHGSAMVRMSWFVDNYVKGKGKVRVLDVGSYNVNGCMRPLFDGMEAEYVGLDIAAGPNVDVVMNDPYNWDNVPDESFDFVVSANAFEHIEYPWVTIKLIYSKLKPESIACILAPNTAIEHKFPFDCYRYFSDGFRALAKWAGFQVINTTVGGVPSLSAPSSWDNMWNDAMMVIIKSHKTIRPDDYPALPYERRLMFFPEETPMKSLFKIWLKHVSPTIYAVLKRIKGLFVKS